MAQIRTAASYHTLMGLPGRLASILERLGSTPEAVADTLRQAGVHGVRHTVRQMNPVIRHIAVEAPGMLYGDVIQGGVLRATFEDGTQEEEALPPAVIAFLKAFHSGLYPDLVSRADDS